jgi:TPR repeat protein
MPAWAGFEDGKQAAMRGDYAAAYAEWRPLADRGHADAQFLIGLMYREGRAVNQDLVEALVWLRLAAEQDHADARFFLARALREGQGTERDHEEAARWYRLAAEQGHAEAAFTLGLMYRKGEGVAADDAQAARWYRKAADLGHGQARFTLGAITEEGRSVRKDLVQAYAWYTLAGESGIELGAVLRERVARQMKPDEIAAARALTGELRAGRRVVAAPAPEKSAPPPKIAAVPEPAPVLPPAPPPKPAPPPSEKAAPEKTPEAPAYRVRLAAYRSIENLAKGWKMLRRAHADLLGKLTESRHRVDLGAEKGVYHRLEVGPFANRADAAALCAALKSRKVDCIVVSP